MQETHTHTHNNLPLKVSLKDGKTCEKILKVELAGEPIQKEFDEYYKAIASKAKVPGFRPGKVPRNILELHFAGEAKESVLKHLMNESYHQAVKEKTLEPLGYPEIEELQFENGRLSYQAKVEVRPKIKLSRVEGLSVKKEAVEIKPEEIEQTITQIRDSLAQYKAIEDRPSQMGDYLIADYTCWIEGKEIEKKQDDWFEIKEEGEFLQGFARQLTGLTPGAEKEVQVTFPEKMGRKEFAGKPARFVLKVKEIKSKTLPELNDELAQAAGEFKTLEELKAKIRQDIVSHKEHDAEIKYEKALLDELVKHNKIDLPEGLVKRRLARLVEEGSKHHAQRHAGGGGQEKPEELKAQLTKELEPEARRQVHLAFLLDEIAVKQNFTIAETEIKERFKKVAEEVRQPLESVERYYAEHEDALAALHDQIQNEKSIGYIKEKAK